MKDATLHSLITAKTLYESASELCKSENRHTSTAGLVVLQDALELIFLSLLVELGIDEVKNTESITFDQLIGELRSNGIKVAKSGTLKALNKHRVLAKHYGQLAEPTTVKNYLAAAQLAVDSALTQVVGKKLHEIYLTDLLDAGQSLDFLKSASKHLEEHSYLEALLDIRKAIYVEIEKEYSVYRWKDFDSANHPARLGLSLLLDGRKAPSYTKNKEWINKNVKSPTDYVQIDFERLRLDCFEWGVNTAELDNLRRLTPKVFRENSKSKWHFMYESNFDANEATPENVQYCLDRAIAVLLKKQSHNKSRRYPRRENSSEILPFYIGDPVHEIASHESPILHVISNDFEYTFSETLTGFDGTMFYRVICSSKEVGEDDIPVGVLSGFLGIRNID